MTPPTRAPRPRRRDEILGSAAVLFAERGFHRVTMDDIGARVGITGPALYHHFASKDALLDEMLVVISQRLLEGGRQIVRYSPDPSAALNGLVLAQIDFALRDASLITVQDRDLIHLSDAAQRRVRRAQRAYVELWVEQLVAIDERVAEPQARAAVHAVIGLINSTPHSARIGRAAMESLLAAMAHGALRSLELVVPAPVEG